jgi:hypothetical protein
MKFAKQALRKIIKEEYRQVLKEMTLLNYSKSALKQMMDLFHQAQKGGPSEPTLVQVPFSEVFYGGKNIENGSFLFYLIDVTDKNPSDLSAINKHWDQEKRTFDNEVLEIPKVAEFEIVFSVTDRPGARISFNWDYQRFSLEFNKHGDPRSIVQDMKHELRHLTQFVNSVSVNYYQDLINQQGDITKVERQDLRIGSEDVEGFGMGKDPTGIRNEKIYDACDEYCRKQSESCFDACKENLKQFYYADDAEYETFLSDFVEQYVDYFLQNNAYMRAKKKNLSNNEMAIKETQYLLKDDTIRSFVKTFGQLNNVDYDYFFFAMKKYRFKNFAKRLKQELENELNIREQTK